MLMASAAAAAVDDDDGVLDLLFDLPGLDLLRCEDETEEGERGRR